MAFPIKLPKEETPEWRRRVAIEIVRECGRDMQTDVLAYLDMSTAFEWCFQAFGQGVPVTLATALEVQGVARVVGIQLTWGKDLAESVGRIPEPTQ